MNASTEKTDNIVEDIRRLGDEEFDLVIRNAIYHRSRDPQGVEAAAETLGKCLADLCNGDDSSVRRGWYKSWVQTHPTLRQTVVRTFAGLLSHWVGDWDRNKRTPDARDKASFLLARKIRNDKDAYFPLI